MLNAALDPSRQADVEDVLQDRPVYPQLLGVQMDLPVRAAEPAVEQGGAECVGDHGGNGHAVHRHMQHGHEKQIQQHIQNTGSSQGHEGDLRIAHTAENGRFKVVQQDHRHARQIDPQIQQRQGEHIVRHMEGPQQRSGDQFAQNRHQHAADNRHRHRGVDRLLHRVPVPPAHSVGNDHIGSQGNADEHVDDEANDGVVGPHRRHCQRPRRAGEVAHHRHIGGIEQLFQNGCGRHRQGKLRQLVPDGPVKHIQLFLCLCCQGKFPLFPYRMDMNHSTVLGS